MPISPAPWYMDPCADRFEIIDATGKTVACELERGDAALTVAAPALRRFVQKLGVKLDEDIAMLAWSEAVNLLLDLAREARALVAKADGAQ